MVRTEFTLSKLTSAASFQYTGVRIVIALTQQIARRLHVSRAPVARREDVERLGRIVAHGSIAHNIIVNVISESRGPLV